MDCPKCRVDCLVPLLVVSPRGKGSWTCRRCGGVWLYLEDLPRIARQLTDQPVSAPASDDQEQDAKAGLCPDGHGILGRARIELEEAFFLDRCVACGGIWFDSGEWQRLATHHLLDDLPELWTEAWQDKQRERRQRESYLSWARSVFGDELFAQLAAIAAELKDHPHFDEALAFIRNESEQQEKE